jgi:hypothetical protein
MAVAAAGNNTPLRRAARRFPGLRRRCSDKAVLPSACPQGRTLRSGPLRQGQRMAPFARQIPAAETIAPENHSAGRAEPSALPCQSRGRGLQPLLLKKLCRLSNQQCGVDHKLTTRTVAITSCKERCSCDHRPGLLARCRHAADAPETPSGATLPAGHRPRRALGPESRSATRPGHPGARPGAWGEPRGQVRLGQPGRRAVSPPGPARRPAPSAHQGHRDDRDENDDLGQHHTGHQPVRAGPRPDRRVPSVHGRYPHHSRWAERHRPVEARRDRCGHPRQPASSALFWKLPPPVTSGPGSGRASG